MVSSFRHFIIITSTDIKGVGMVGMLEKRYLISSIITTTQYQWENKKYRTNSLDISYGCKVQNHFA